MNKHLQAAILISALTVLFGAIYASLTENMLYLVIGLSGLEIVTIISEKLKSRNWKMLGFVSAAALPFLLLTATGWGQVIVLFVNAAIIFLVLILGGDDDGPSPLRRLRFNTPPKLVPVANR